MDTVTAKSNVRSRNGVSADRQSSGVEFIIIIIIEKYGRMG